MSPTCSSRLLVGRKTRSAAPRDHRLCAITVLTQSQAQSGTLWVAAWCPGSTCALTAPPSVPLGAQLATSHPGRRARWRSPPGRPAAERARARRGRGREREHRARGLRPPRAEGVVPQRAGPRHLRGRAGRAPTPASRARAAQPDRPARGGAGASAAAAAAEAQAASRSPRGAALQSDRGARSGARRPRRAAERARRTPRGGSSSGWSSSGSSAAPARVPQRTRPAWPGPGSGGSAPAAQPRAAERPSDLVDRARAGQHVVGREGPLRGEVHARAARVEGHAGQLRAARAAAR